MQNKRWFRTNALWPQYQNDGQSSLWSYTNRAPYVSRGTTRNDCQTLLRNRSLPVFGGGPVLWQKKRKSSGGVSGRVAGTCAQRWLLATRRSLAGYIYYYFIGHRSALPPPRPRRATRSGNPLGGLIHYDESRVWCDVMALLPRTLGRRATRASRHVFGVFVPIAGTGGTMRCYCFIFNTVALRPASRRVRFWPSPVEWRTSETVRSPRPVDESGRPRRFRLRASGRFVPNI